MADGNWNEMDSQRFQRLEALLIIFHINSNQEQMFQNKQQYRSKYGLARKDTFLLSGSAFLLLPALHNAAQGHNDTIMAAQPVFSPQGIMRVG